MSGKIDACPFCKHYPVKRYRIHRQNSYFCEQTDGGCGHWGLWRERLKLTAAEVDAKKRLEYLRGEIEAERISYGEIAELQGLVKFIEPGDVLLQEWAGVPENQTT